MESFKIAIADDHSLFRQGMKELLQSIGEHKVVLEACNGKELLEGLKNTRPELIMMDNKMPEMDGVEATQLIRRKYPGIKIIALSMYDDDGHVLRMIRAGANGYLLKNADLEVVLETIQEVMTKGRHYDEDTVSIMQRSLLDDVSTKKFEEESVTPSYRELQILKFSAKGLKAEEIGEKLFISKRTVESHRQNLMDKTACKNMMELIAWGFREGYLK